MTAPTENSSDACQKADHICVLVHGLWGNPSHLDCLASTLRDQHGESLYILCPKTNSGNYTYDGIELGAERVMDEIEQTINSLAEQGQQLRKISIIGYSLGGLIARYVIGLLNARGWLEKLDPVNFTTFATPHAGARIPRKGFTNVVWNELGARTVSNSGRQLFLVDSFRDTKRPLLSVLADPESIFIQGLKKFRHRTVYANITNDRTVAFYTSALTKEDPFRGSKHTYFDYALGYDNVIVNSMDHVLPPAEEEATTRATRERGYGKSFWLNLPVSFLIVVFVPVIFLFFLVNAGVQTIRSQKRIRIHSMGELVRKYQLPLWVQGAHHVEDAFQNISLRREPAYLPGNKIELLQPSTGNEVDIESALSSVPPRIDVPSDSPSFPRLELTPAQCDIIDSLNDVGFRKHPVHITKHLNSHAAIVVREFRDSSNQGWVVMKHWINEVFIA
ncbi:hypothetical protein ABOM_003318 [Aspergillus bombycis]|uniref:DUF676 domain-containing protein n=1 Tax=Aspergillus bombycis TaxID=109264 RepID=A0A1F8A8W0_9EURO|nr:hypothetical protein ABOM_003318 [Aspergillus bombycis]OGM47859.1 hypothetical protein ABOM_003318 [Aspergillus bombycis]